MVPEDDLGICAAAFVCEGFEPEIHAEGLTQKQLTTQSFHGKILEEVEKYIVL